MTYELIDVTCLDVSEPVLMREVLGGWTTARYRK